jgi:hypothetical protein
MGPKRELHLPDPSATGRVSERGVAEDEWPDAQPVAERGSLSAYDLTRGRFLGVDIEVADFTTASLEGRLSALIPHSGLALWIVPFRGLSPASTHVPIDLVYLDKDNVVLDVVEYFPIGRVSSSSKPAASLLALPADTIASVGIAPGDQLLLCGPEEMKQRLRALPSMEAGNAEQLTSAPGLKKGWLQRMFQRGPRNLRRSQRESAPGIVARFFTGGAPTAHAIRDISASGVYIVTEERWYLGTILRLTFCDRRESSTASSLTVNARVVRWGNDGVGFEFVLEDDNGRRRKHATLDVPTGNVTRDVLEYFLCRAKIAKN